MNDYRNFIQGEAELGSESDDGDFDEETGETRPKQNGNRTKFEDSSEEEDEDDEEEAERVSTALAPSYTRVQNNEAYWSLDTRRIYCRRRGRA